VRPWMAEVGDASATAEGLLWVEKVEKIEECG
jgi:hypothetical protein